MNLTISFGWWVAPALVTQLSFAGIRLFWPRMDKQGGHMFPDMGGAFIELLGYALALIVSLVAWLIWAVI